MNQNGNDNGQNNNEPYSFMRETRKKRPVDKKIWIRRALITAAFSICAGLLAAFVFALTEPKFQKLLHGDTVEREQIEMASVSASSVEETDSENVEKEKEPELVDPVEFQEEMEEQMKETALQQYKDYFNGMMDTAREAGHSMVDVITISSQMDYFNHNYENQQQISGLLIAESKSKLFCLTENRNLKDAEEIRLIFWDGSIAKAKFHSYDVETGLAILSIKRSDLSENTLGAIRIAELGNSTVIRQGDPVIAVGSLMGLGGSMEYGIITTMKNSVSLWDVNYDIFITDMVGSSSGSGVLLNVDGEVVGVILQRFSPDNQNMLTAIPSRQLNGLIEGLLNETPQIRIGIKGQTVDSVISESSGIPKGILVTEVDPESPAMYAGIKEYDVITGVAGQEISTFAQYQRVIGELEAGAEVQVNAMRMGKEAYEEISFQLIPGTK